MRVALGEMTWEEIRETIGPQTVTIIPTGATEQHGPHLPLLVDAILAEEFARRAALAVRGEARAVVTPVVWLGYSRNHMMLPGTLTCPPELFMDTVKAAGRSLYHHGFRRFLILNGHGGNDGLVQIVARELLDLKGAIAATFSYWNVASDAMSAISEPDVGVGHAGEFETACMLALRPDLVRESKIRPHEMPWPSELAQKLLTNRGAFIQGAGLGDLKSEIGVYGNPARASRELGERLVTLVVNSVAGIIRDISRV